MLHDILDLHRSTGGATITRPTNAPMHASLDKIFSMNEPQKPASGGAKSPPSLGIMIGCIVGGLVLGVGLVLTIMYIRKRRKQGHHTGVADQQISSPGSSAVGNVHEVP